MGSQKSPVWSFIRIGFSQQHPGQHPRFFCFRCELGAFSVCNMLVVKPEAHPSKKQYVYISCMCNISISTPKSIPQSPKWKEFHIINCWLGVWGMFQGYVEKCLDSWNCPLNWWNILAEGSYTAQAPQTDLESYPSWRSCQASFLSKTTRNAWSFERAVVAVWVSWMYITNKLSYMYIYIYTCIIYKL